MGSIFWKKLFRKVYDFFVTSRHGFANFLESRSYRCEDFANFARKCLFLATSRFGQFCCEGPSEPITCADPADNLRRNEFWFCEGYQSGFLRQRTWWHVVRMSWHRKSRSFTEITDTRTVHNYDSLHYHSNKVILLFHYKWTIDVSNYVVRLRTCIRSLSSRCRSLSYV